MDVFSSIFFRYVCIVRNTETSSYLIQYDQQNDRKNTSCCKSTVYVNFSVEVLIYYRKMPVNVNLKKII